MRLSTPTMEALATELVPAALQPHLARKHEVDFAHGVAGHPPDRHHRQRQERHARLAGRPSQPHARRAHHDGGEPHRVSPPGRPVDHQPAGGGGRHALRARLYRGPRTHVRQPRHERRDGMQAFDQSLYRLYQGGRISYDTALRWASNPDEFKMRVQDVTSTAAERATRWPPSPASVTDETPRGDRDRRQESPDGCASFWLRTTDDQPSTHHRRPPPRVPNPRNVYLS